MQFHDFPPVICSQRQEILTLPDLKVRNVLLDTLAESPLSQSSSRSDDLEMEEMQPEPGMEEFQNQTTEMHTPADFTQDSDYEASQRVSTQESFLDSQEARDNDTDSEAPVSKKRSRTTESLDSVQTRYLYVIWCYHLPYCKLGFTSNEKTIRDRYGTYYGNYSVLWSVS